MPVTNIIVRFSRKVQVRQFEPMEAEITATWSPDEDGKERVPSAAAFLIETKEAVMMGLRHKAVAAMAAADGETEMKAGEPHPPEDAFAPTVPPRELGKPSPGKKRRTAMEVAEDAARLADMMPTETDPSPDPVGDLGPATTAEPNPADTAPADDLGPDPEVATVGPDMSDFDTTEVAEPSTEINDAELLKIATAGASTLGPDNVRTIIAGFGVKQLVQLDPDQRATFRTQVTEAIAAAKS